MSLRARFRRMRDDFEAKFEAIGDDLYLLHRNAREGPIAVSTHERDRLIRQFVWRVRFGALVIPAVILVIAGVALFLWGVDRGDLPNMPFYLGVGLFMVGVTYILAWGQITPACVKILEQVQREFEAQFEPAGDESYLYRRSQTGEAIPVTAAERDRFIDQYLWRIKLIMATVITAPFAALLLWWMTSRADVPDVPDALGIGALVLIIFVLMSWVAGSPARQLARRKPVGRERSRVERLAIMAKNASYLQLAAAAGAAVLLVVMQALQEDVLSGWNRLWMLFGGGLLLAIAVQAFRKWRFEREHPDDLI